MPYFSPQDALEPVLCHFHGELRPIIPKMDVFQLSNITGFDIIGWRGPTRYTSTSSHARLTEASTITAPLCSSGLSDSAAMFVSPSIFFSPENDSRPPRWKAATYSESAIKILLASTFDNMCHKTGLEPCFHISLSNTLGGRARELIKTSHTAPTC